LAAQNAVRDWGVEMARTHIEVTEANEGRDFFGIHTGQLLKVERETAAFVFAVCPNGATIKISKKTKRFSGGLRQVINGAVRRLNVSPVFNV